MVVIWRRTDLDSNHMASKSFKIAAILEHWPPYWKWGMITRLWRNNSQGLFWPGFDLCTRARVSVKAGIMVHCLAVGCSNTYKNSKGRITFHKLPEDKYRRKQWLAKIKREGELPRPENCRVCSDHFTTEDYERDLQVWKFLILLRLLRIHMVNSMWYSIFLLYNQILIQLF